VETVRALVSVDAVGALATAARDNDREVRVATAKGLAAVAAPPADGTLLLDTLALLVADADPLVRGAAFEALGTTGCPAGPARTAVAALADGAWRARAGAATALGAADPAVAVPALAEALDDAHADVRKAAVLALLRHRTDERARSALAGATDDTDADVRAYAARGGA
jgi:HEAT repeat protein